ncbi:protein quaking-A isoform X2 [Strongylocentrotus purpuratus]|uniref:K Homology domain-containing protein n=1 Tax=Strongylocentrotus purpuratus TaxID=7668 RepID=A0A7M7HQW1_STRPU|nr:protein quaking-A isoform X2 [Strongylocentrotus purpuratus]|eukprot:XP_011681234.1 PREDICTED: protein quaking-A isoform X2 [Strongylocentrotus purpuratus]
MYNLQMLQMQFTPPPQAAPAPNKMNEMAERPLVQCSPEYLAQLMKDKTSYTMVSSMFVHVERLLDDEINRVRRSLYSITSTSQPLMLPKAEGSLTQMSEKLYVPVKAYPDFNFVGRILGPRGMTAKQLEKDTGCKIMVRGKGSMRDKVKEDMNRGKPNWEHLNEELHVLITVDDTKERAELKLKKACEEIKKLLVPTAEGEDDLKKRQLIELALMKGTYRDNTNKLQTSTGIAATPLTSPRTMQSPAGALIPQPMRSPTPAAQAHMLAPQLLPRMAATTMVNGLGGIQASPTMMHSHDGSNILMPLDPYQQYAFTPAMLEYPPSMSDGTLAGMAPKLRRTIRDHPYQRAMLDPRGFSLT